MMIQYHLRTSKGNSTRLAILCLLTLNQCGVNKADTVKIEILPANPIVIASDITIGDPAFGLKVKAPWFKFQVKVTNNSDEPVTLVGLSLTIRSGASTTSVAFDPSAQNVGTCSYQTFGTFQPKDAKFLFATSSVAGCPTIDNPSFFASADSTGGRGKTTVFSFSVSMKPQGWFGTQTVPTNRFSKTVNFSTQ